MEHFKLDKLPPWAWGVAIAGGLAFWWFSRQSGGGSGGGQSALPPAQGSVNTATPNCPNYPIPTCTSTQSLVWTQDNQGCPQPICQDNGGGGGQTDEYVTTNGNTTFYSAAQVWRCWGDLTVRTWISLHGHPELAAHSLYTALPAGIKLKVCGSQ